MNPAQPAVQSKETNGQLPPKFKIIDCDIHPRMKSINDLSPYLSKAWQKRIGLQEGGDKTSSNPRNIFQIPRRHFFHPHPGGSGRTDARPEDGSPIGSDIELVRKQLLDEHNIELAIIVGQDCTGLSGIADPDLGSAFASAYNDYILNEWVGRDPRLKMAIWVHPRDPHLAAKEIDRLGDHPDCVSVQISPTNVPLGQRVNYPIYEAALRHNLPVAIHGGSESAGINPPMLAVGSPNYFIELHSGLPQIGWMHVTSMICEGVFERYPNLTFIVQEMGYAWVPGLMWRLDKEWKSLRIEVPWVKRPPSQYILDHVRFTSQPVEEPPKAKFVPQILEMIEAEKTLIFSSDYPHWDFDDPRFVFPNIDPALRQKIFYDNPLEAHPKLKKFVNGH